MSISGVTPQSTSVSNSLPLDQTGVTTTETIPLSKTTSPPTKTPSPSQIQAQAPEDSILHDLALVADVFSLIFVGKDSSELKSKFALYNPQKGVLSNACELLKATGRAAALVLGSVLVGVSRAIAFGGSALIGGLLTMATMASVIGLLWMILGKNSFETLKDAAKFMGSAAAAVPAFVGACCQQLAFQKPGNSTNITAKDLFTTTWEQHTQYKSDNVSIAGLGAGIGVGIGMILALTLKTVAGMK